MTKLEIRESGLACRASEDVETREITGIGVPWDEESNTWGFVELFERGSVSDDGAVALFAHDTREVVGRIIAAEDTDAGRQITAKISRTARGDEVLTLARDGLLQWSIGFVPVDHYMREDGATVRTKVVAKEYSLVTFPAYAGAQVTSVRSDDSAQVRANQPEERLDMSDIVTATDLLEVRETVEDLERKVATFTTASREPVVDRRSAGEVLKAMVAGDQATIDAYTALMTRDDPPAPALGVLADAIVKPAWVGDLTRIFDATTGVLAAAFSTGPLPSSGMTIEFGELDANTVDVAKQAAEGDEITMGNVKIKSRTAPVHTYAGGSSLSRQVIERSTVGVLNHTLNALTMAAGARKKAVLRAEYNTLVAARRAIAADAGVVALGKKLSVGTADDWEDMLVDAALKYEALNLQMERMLVSATVFKKLRGLTVSGERVFRVAEGNSSGGVSLLGLTGNFAGLPVHLDSGQTGDSAVFVNSAGLRQYESGLVSLADETITNLTKTFAVYKYGAVAAEIPAAVVPVKFVAEQ